MSSALSPRARNALAALVIAGGAGGLRALRDVLRDAVREQQRIVASAGGGETAAGGKPRAAAPKVAVDAVFAGRLANILKVCVPSPFCAEAGLIYAQTALLVARTLLTDWASRIEGAVGRYIIVRDRARLRRLLGLFCAVAVPASVVNAGLKYLQRRIKLAFVRRLTLHLHELYCSNRAYYAASWLGGLSAPDQRLTEDVDKFASAASELYSYTFKPLLDVALFTRSLGRIMGYRSQAILYAYYGAVALLLRATSPPLASMGAQEAALGGSFRRAHQRLATHAEEVAFNDPPAGHTEQMILNQHLWRLLRHARLSALLHFVQNSLDGYVVKYGATVVALGAYARFVSAADAPGRAGESTADYIRAMRLLANTSRGVGDLVLVYKRVTALAGHTARVAELLEQVAALGGDRAPRVHERLYVKNVSSGCLVLPTAPDGSAEPPPEPRRLEGPVLGFRQIYLSAPDGSPLVRGLTFAVRPGESALVMGPNGSGKSSLFRVAAGLWPLQAGEVTLPPKGELFYLSQRPYLVSGSLRDQVTYPDPPRAVLASASARARARAAPFATSWRLDADALDERLSACLDAVGLDYLLGRGRGWEQVQEWEETLSGGEKQRLAMARLLFHAPRYAVLDEATSAVSADGERELYAALVRARITLLSIGHRPALRSFHTVAVHFEGGVGGGRGWRVERLRGSDAEGLAEVEAAEARAAAGP